MIINEKDIFHECMEAYNQFFIDNNFYFYPVADDNCIIRQNLVDNREVILPICKNVSGSIKMLNKEVSQRKNKRSLSKRGNQRGNQVIKSTLNYDDEELLILSEKQKKSAPTGVAAFNIDGLTLKTVKLFIIDKVSMLSNVTFVFINLRLCEIFDLIGEDDVDCAPAMKKRMHKILENKDDKVSGTADIERVIAIKIGAKVMIRQNIDVTLELVNGTIGNVIAIINRPVDGNSLLIPFPLSLNYGITVHKSYVGLSRVNTLEGLHLINFNLAFVKANSGAIVEYNRLRSVFKATINPFVREKGCEISRLSISHT
ncbi:hypothetical protein ALC53_11683 [Atta colombica]|uniref:DNA helicase Pif1-like 2B domain-containing protein n=1 Tax=Atta colombica TaxID=520822 RepID=A0A195AZK5_9HYME|nr:hypothetical protein ALC53_11683 [Atta colombica]